MNKSSSNWNTKPSKTQLLIVLAVWIISMVMIMIGTDWFKTAIPFNIVLLLMLPSFVVVLNLIANYIKHKVKNNS